jgi:hypothetical protein
LIVGIAISGTGLVIAGLNFLKPSGRAWLAPIDAVLDGPIEVNKEIKVLVALENTGAEPAFDVYVAAGGGISVPLTAEEAEQQQQRGPHPSIIDGCLNVTPHEGYPVVLPTKSPQRMQAVLNRTFIAEPAIIDGQRTFYVHGCVAYRTGKENHTSEFCYWLGPRIDPATGLRRFQPCLGSFKSN